MSGVIIAGDVSGSVTLQAPSAAGSTVLTLPATSGTLVTTAGGTATTATNLAGGSAGTVPYQTSSGATAMLAAGTSGQFLTSNGAAAPTWTTVAAPNTSGGATVTNPMSTNITLTSSSNRVQVLTPDAQSRRITLPDATTISAAGGPIFVLQNTVPWYPVAVMDSAGNNIGWVVADYESRVYLTSTAAATGNWVIKTGNASADAGVYPFDALYTPTQTSSGGSYIGQYTIATMSTDLAVAMTAASNSQNVYQYSLLTQPNKSNYGVSVASNSISTASYANGYQLMVPVSTTMIMYLYYDTTNGRLATYVASIDPSTGAGTKGSELYFTGPSVPQFAAVAIDSTHVLVIYNPSGTTYTASIMSISGTTVTQGTTYTITGSASTGYSQVSLLSSTLAHFTDGVKVWDLTLNAGAGTVTVNNSVTISGTSVQVYGLAKNNATSSIVFYRSNALLVAAVVTSSAGTPTQGTVSGTLGAGATTAYVTVNYVKDGYALVLISSGAASSVGPRFVLVSVTGGIPVLSYKGTFPGAVTGYQTFVNFVSGLGVTPNQINTSGNTNGASYACQKIAIVGGI